MFCNADPFELQYCLTIFFIYMSTNFQHYTHLLFSSRVSLSARKKITQDAASCIFSIPLSADSYEETTKKCIIATRCLEKNISLNSFSVRFDVVEHKYRRDCIFYIWPVVKQTKNKNSSALARKNSSAISNTWNEWHRGVSKIFSTQLSKRERDKQYEALRTFIVVKVRKTSTHKLFFKSRSKL